MKIISIYNGLADDPDWSCGGYRFRRLDHYATKLKRLPRLAGSRGGRVYRARIGTHVATFEATQIGSATPRPSMWYRDGTSLHDVLALWSFAGGMPVCAQRARRPPTADDTSCRLAEPDDVVAAISHSYGSCRRRPVGRRVWSGLLTYLEIAHVRMIQIRAALIASVFECLAPLSNASAAASAGSMPPARYEPIISLMSKLPATSTVERARLASLIVELYAIRNRFLHSGVHPYREDIDIGGVTVTTGRVVSASRILAKLALAEALRFPRTWTVGILGQQVELFFGHGSFVPRHMGSVAAARRRSTR